MSLTMKIQAGIYHHRENHSNNTALDDREVLPAAVPNPAFFSTLLCFSI
jgi:hypothetical protein